jgi:hypothetical protein
VPIEYGMADLLSKVQWLKDNDDIAHRIANAGTEFAVEYFDPAQQLAYMATLLSHYAQLLDYPVVKREGAELVSQKKGCAAPTHAVLKSALGDISSPHIHSHADFPESSVNPPPIRIHSRNPSSPAESFYKQHAPDKTSKVEAALEHFKGRERELVKKLEAQYRAPLAPHFTDTKEL